MRDFSLFMIFVQLMILNFLLAINFDHLFEVLGK